MINKNLLIKSIKDQMKAKGDTQLSLEMSLKITQSQLSKILNGDFSREGQAVKKLIKYSNYYRYMENLKKSDIIQGAVEEVWDGSEDMERQIACTIKEIGTIWRVSGRKKLDSCA